MRGGATGESGGRVPLHQGADPQGLKESQVTREGTLEQWELVTSVSPGPRGSERCRLLRREVGKLPLERRRWRLDSIAAGATIPGGGCFPSLPYKSSISCFCSVCSASTSAKCLRTHQGRERAGPTLGSGKSTSCPPSSPDSLLPKILQLSPEFLVLSTAL